MRIVSELSSTNPVPVDVVSGSSGGSLTDRSGSITTGGTAQQLAAANSSRSYFILQNISTGDLWFNFGVAAVADQPSFKLAAGQSFAMEGSFISTQLISIIGATTGQKFVAKEAS
jgi:hypothetical protein